jgi:2-C-methyl-D-erythritol 4-phosphate cytidylyltransferase
LHEALQQALADGFEVTDEASAIEHSGKKPRLVEGHADNIKITRPEDLALARFFLQQIPQ